MPAPITRICTHHRPHVDEIFAIRLLKKHGEEKFPGVRTARIEYVRNGEAPGGKSWAELLAEGTLMVGVGGGPFDEHPTTSGDERKTGKSACMLVAEELRLAKHPVYKQLIELVTEADQTGVHALHISNRLKTRYRLHPDNPEMVVGFAHSILDDWEAEQRLFLDGQKQLHELSGTGAHYKVVGGNGTLDLVVVKSDNFKLGQAARSMGIAILVQIQPAGHVQIFSNTSKHNFKMQYVAAEWRKEEARAAGMSKADVKQLDADYLTRPGKVKEASNIFYQVPGENVLNGTETTPATLPTRVRIDKIINIVKTSAFAEPATELV